MKDKSVLLAWCSGIGALLLVVLLIRAGVNQTPATVQRPPNPQALDIETVPLPPPPSLPATVPQEEIEQDLREQKELVEDLQDDLQAQRELINDLKTQLERQQEDNERVMTYLEDYQDSVETMTSQQARLIDSIPQNNQTQTMLLWGILSLFAMLLLGGGAAFIIFALWLMRIQHQGPPPHRVYPMQMPVDPYQPYDRQPLPPPSYRQQYVQYDVRPLDK